MGLPESGLYRHLGLSDLTSDLIYLFADHADPGLSRAQFTTSDLHYLLVKSANRQIIN